MSVLIQVMYENAQEIYVLSEQLCAVLFVQVILGCLSFRRWMAPMEHLKQPPVVYGKCIFCLGFFSPKYLYYHLMHHKFFWGMDFQNLVGMVLPVCFCHG